MESQSAPTLRWHLLLLVVLSAIPAFALIAYSGWEQYAHLRGMLTDQSTAVARHIAGEQQKLLADTRQLLTVVAQLPEISKGDLAACHSTLSGLVKMTKVYANFGVATLDGKVVCRGRPLSRDVNIADRPYFKEVIETGGFAISNYAIGRAIDRPVLVMASAILDDKGRVAGVVFAVVPLTWFNEMAAESGVPDGYTVTVLDDEFDILARYPEDGWTGQNIASRPLAAALRSVNQEGTAEFPGLDGEPYFFAFAPLQGFHRGDVGLVLVGAPTGKIYAEARMALARNISALLIVIVIVVIGALFGADRLVLRYINKLLAATRKLRSGDMSARVTDIGGSREIVTLEHAFNETASTLQEHMARIERLNRVYGVLSGINRAIVRIRDRNTLLEEVCRIAVEIGGFAAATIRVPDAATRSALPVAFAGVGPEFIDKLHVSLDPQDPQGRGMASVALREKRHVVHNTQLDDPECAPWRDLLAQIDFRSGGAFPIMVEGTAEAVLSLYAREAGYFDDEEIRLLLELAGDTALALEFMHKEEDLRQLSYFDRLTGLPNRSLCEDRLAQAIKGQALHQRNIGALIVRINRFRQINHVGGWLAGDAVLKDVAAYLERSLREGDTIARHGDNEFAVILTDVNDVAEVMAITDKILAGFPRVVHVEKREIVISVSAGIAIYPNDATEALDLMQKAQIALDSHPADGTTNFTFYSRETDEKAHQRQRIEAEFYHALERGELVLHYQPIVGTDSRKPEAAETLLRWSNPALGNVSPRLFMSIAEETGLIVPIGYWIIEQTCLQLRAWREMGLTAISVSVNVSVHQLRDPDFLGRVKDILGRTAFDPSILRLGMEITESELMPAVDHSMTVLHGLRQLGILLSIDDFGTGYSSLSYLQELPVNTLKIDISFVRKITANPDAVAITRSIIALAHGLGMDVVAEGVETEEQLAVLRELRCDKAQGYLFSRALPAIEIEQFLRREA